MCPPFITPGRTEYRTLPSTVHVIVCLFVAAGTCLATHYTAMDDLENVFTKQLSSNGHLCGASLTAHFRHSGVMSQYSLTDITGDVATVFN